MLNIIHTPPASSASPWGFKSSQSEIFLKNRSEPLKIHLKKDITDLLGPRLEEQQWRFSTEIKEKYELNTLCIEDFGTFHVEILRVQGNFGGTCRYPTLKIKVADSKSNTDQFFKLFGDNEVFLSMPCWTIEKNASQGSDDLEKARAEHFQEFFELKMQSKLGLPHLAVAGSVLHFHAQNSRRSKVNKEWAYLLESANAIALRHGLPKNNYFEGKGKLPGLPIKALMAAAIQLNLLSPGDFELGYNSLDGKIEVRNGFYFSLNEKQGFFTPFDHGLALTKAPRLWAEKIETIGVNSYDIDFREIFYRNRSEGCEITHFLIEHQPAWVEIKERKYKFSRYREYLNDPLPLLAANVPVEHRLSFEEDGFMNAGLFYQALYAYNEDYCTISKM